MIKTCKILLFLIFGSPNDNHNQRSSRHSKRQTCSTSWKLHFIHTALSSNLSLMCSKLAHKTGPCEGLERECEKRAAPKFVQTLKKTYKTFLNTYYKGNSSRSVAPHRRFLYSKRSSWRALWIDVRQWEPNTSYFSQKSTCKLEFLERGDQNMQNLTFPNFREPERQP